MDDRSVQGDSSRPRILLLTETFPAQEGECSFLAPEVSRLAKNFDIVLLPRIERSSGQWELPRGVFLEPALSKHLSRGSVRIRSFLEACFTVTTYQEIRSLGRRGLSPRAAASVIIRASRMISTRAWVQDYLAHHEVDVAYSWWAFTSGYGLALAAHDMGVPSIARAHGFEVFDEQDRLGRVPFQRAGIAAFSRVYAVSSAGAQVLRDKVPSAASRIHVRYLGVEPAPGPGFRSEDGIFRVLSCSSCVDVKRVDLLAEGIVEFARKYPDVGFQWMHIGDGPTLTAVRGVISRHPHISGKCFFPGSQPPSTVRAWMAGRPFDAFVNVSSSEGLPVTLMEAASSGIPLVATDVGGNAEIVKPGSGYLLPRDPSPEDIADVLFGLSQLPLVETMTMRSAVKQLWAAEFSADANYGEFAEILLTLVSETK